MNENFRAMIGWNDLAEIQRAELALGKGIRCRVVELGLERLRQEANGGRPFGRPAAPRRPVLIPKRICRLIEDAHRLEHGGDYHRSRQLSLL